MPRPVSWLPRLHEIRRSVGSSVRSHYDRRDLQALFELQPRAAQKLLELLPSIAVGTSRLVEREALAAFLERVADSDDMTGLLEQVRSEKVMVSRKKPRSLVRRDVEPISVSSLAGSISLERGRLTVDFQTLEQLAEAMYSLARVLENDGDALAAMCEPEKPTPPSQDYDDMSVLFKELGDCEARAIGKICT